MSTRHHTALILACLFVATACSEAAFTATGPDVATARGGNGNGNGNGNGGGGPPPPPVVDELEAWDATRWTAENHALGKGWLDPANVSHDPAGLLLLTLPAGAWDGAEIKSAQRHQYRDIEARLRTPDTPGSISALFFYEGVRRRNDEIDIEIFNDGSRTILFTTWVQGKQTNHVQMTLGFDPANGFHDYRIEWARDRVGFLVDGTLMAEFTSGVPRDDMFVMSNTWWPTWLNGPQPAAPSSLHIDRIVY